MSVPFVIAMFRVQCVASHVQRGDLAKIVPRNVSVTTAAFVCPPLDSVSAALDTQENGKNNFKVPCNIQQFVGFKLAFRALNTIDAHS